MFKNAALSMFDIIAEKKSQSRCEAQRSLPEGDKDSAKRSAASPKGTKSQVKKISIKQKAGDLEELFVNWLNELLSLYATKESVFIDFKISKLDKNNLQATLVGIDMKNYQVNKEIKAATYHQLKIEKTKSGYQAEVIFDV